MRKYDIPFLMIDIAIIQLQLAASISSSDFKAEIVGPCPIPNSSHLISQIMPACLNAIVILFAPATVSPPLPGAGFSQLRSVGMLILYFSSISLLESAARVLALFTHLPANIGSGIFLIIFLVKISFSILVNDPIDSISKSNF